MVRRHKPTAPVKATPEPAVVETSETTTVETPVASKIKMVPSAAKPSESTAFIEAGRKQEQAAAASHGFDGAKPKVVQRPGTAAAGGGRMPAQ